MRRAVITALVLGFLAGTFLAGLPYAQNEPCLQRSEFLPARAADPSVLGVWPYGTRCEYPAADGAVHHETHAAGILEGIGWVLVATLVFALALLRPSAATRGAAAALTLLAVIGLLWQFGGEAAPVLMFLVTFGFLVPYAVLRRLRHGDRIRTALTALALTGTVSFTWVVGDFGGFPYLAIAAALAVGALTAKAAAAIMGPRASAVPAH